MTYSEPLVPFLQAWEGLKLVPSRDPLNPSVVDVGHGHVLLPGEDVGPDGRITREEALELLRWDLELKCDAVDELITVPLEQHQADAIISWTFNLGEKRLRTSSLLRRINARDFVGASEEFSKWVYAGDLDRPVPGLVKRRAAERDMFVAGEYGGRP